MNNNGLVIWEGESQIDGSPIVLIMTGLLYSANRKTGFTSQWRDEYAQELKGFVQASCNSIEDMQLAKSMGWMTYTSLPVGHPKVEGLLECRFKDSGGAIKCETCLLCDGSKSHIMIEDHGLKHKLRTYEPVEKKELNL